MGFNDKTRTATDLLRLHDRLHYRYYNVKLPNGSVVRVKTNLFPEDLEKYFPDPREREAYMWMLARISPLWNAEQPSKETEE